MKIITVSIVMLIYTASSPLVSNAGEQEEARNKTASLEEIWGLAEKNAPGLKSIMREIDAIRLSIKALPRNHVPNVFMEAGYSGALNRNGKEHGPIARLVAEWTIWDGGRVRHAKISAEKGAQARIYEQMIAMAGLKESISAVYYQIASSEDVSRMIADEIAHLARLKALALPRVRLGRIGHSDIQEIDIRIAAARGRLASLRGLSELLRGKIALLSGMDKDAVAVPGLAHLKSLPFEDTAAVPVETMPAYKAALERIRSLDAQLEYEKRLLYWPLLGIETYGGYRPYIDAIQPREPELGVGLRISVPLFSSSDREMRLASKQKEIEAMKLSVEQGVVNFRTDYEMRRGRVRNGDIRIKSIETSINSLSENMTLSYSEFSRGIKSLADMLSALQLLSEEKNSLIELKKEVYTLKAELYLLYTIQKSIGKENPMQ